MPRYIVERTFPGGLRIPTDATGAETCAVVVETNLEYGVSWVHSYVSADKMKTYCVYDAPNPEAIRQSASANGLPVEQITEVRVLDPFFYS